MARRKDPVSGRLLVEGVIPVTSQSTGVVTYRARVTHGSAKHRQHASKTFKSSTAAEEWVLSRRIDVSRGAVVDISQMTVSEFYERWINRRVRKKEITGAREFNIRAFWRKHADPVFGDLKIQSVTRHHIQAFVDKLDDDYTPKTVANYGATLRSMFTAAENDEVIARSPYRNIHLPKQEHVDKVVWSPLQMRRFLQTTREHQYGPLWSFMIATGCRVGEAIALKWDSVWPDKGTARIWRTNTINELGRRVVLDRTKNGSSGHYVRLEPWIADIISSQPEGEYVFSVDGKRCHYPHVLASFHRESKRANLPDINLHGLRHSVVSALGNAGIDIGVIQSITGHTDVKSTMGYLHLDLEGQSVGTKHLARMLGFDDDNSTTTTSSEKEG